MLTVLVGSDAVKRAKRLEALFLDLEKKGSEVRTYSDVTFNFEELRTLATASSLFGGTLAVGIYGVGDIAALRDELEKLIPDLSESPHTFIVSETSLPAALLKKVSTKNGTVENFELKDKQKKAEAFNAFLLTDAFADRKRSVAWGLYRQAITLGLEPRELHGKLFWILKALLLSKRTASATEAGLNPFVYAKAKRASGNFTQEELEGFATELATLFHEALVSGINLETALEAFILRSLEKKPALAR